MTNEEIDCEEEPDHEECVCDGDDGDRAYDAWADDMVSFYFEHKMGLKKLVEKWLITLDEANGFDVYRAELEQAIVELRKYKLFSCYFTRRQGVQNRKYL